MVHSTPIIVHSPRVLVLETCVLVLVQVPNATVQMPLSSCLCLSVFCLSCLRSWSADRRTIVVADRRRSMCRGRDKKV